MARLGDLVSFVAGRSTMSAFANSSRIVSRLHGIASGRFETTMSGA
jgi:hypothetical protein